MFNKKMIKSKKAMFFELFVVFGMVLVLTWALTNISEKKKQFLGDDGKPLYIGERELGVLNAYQKGENLLLYVDQSAVYSSQQHALMKHGIQINILFILMQRKESM